MSERQKDHVEWTKFKALIAVLLYCMGIACLIIGINPFISGSFEMKEVASIGPLILIVFYMLSAFKIKKNSHYVFWAGSFSLVIYSTVILLFYESIFS